MKVTVKNIPEFFTAGPGASISKSYNNKTVKHETNVMLILGTALKNETVNVDLIILRGK